MWNKLEVALMLMNTLIVRKHVKTYINIDAMFLFLKIKLDHKNVATNRRTERRLSFNELG